MDQNLLKSLIHLIFDVRRDDALFRQMIDQADGFDTMRKNYQERRELSTLTVNADEKQASLLAAVGFSTNALDYPRQHSQLACAKAEDL